MLMHLNVDLLKRKSLERQDKVKFHLTSDLSFWSGCKSISDY